MINFFLKKEPNSCPVCKKNSVFCDFGNPLRKKVQCSTCGSLERHRFLFFVYKIFFLNTNNKINLLHMSPETCLRNIIISNKNINYFCADLFPENFDCLNCEKQDFTKTTYESNFFDVILSNQVLEHIEKEEECLLDMKRILKDSGVIIINIPFCSFLEKTINSKPEDNEKIREKIYGQKDHVRLYGNDVSKRFEDYGFFVNQIDINMFPACFIEKYRINQDICE